MASQWWSEDERLLSSLKEALRPAAVPRSFVEAGKAAFTWHTIDAELAALVYDSDRPVAAGVTRDQPAAPRALTFASADLTIELEISSDAVFGQLVPAQAGSVTALPRTGSSRNAAVDEMGCFTFRPVPSGPFRLRCQPADGPEVLTGWIHP